MVSELKEVLLKVEQLKDEDQRRIAKIINDEVNWDMVLQNSPTQLNNLAEEAIKEYQSGKTKRKDW